MNLVVMVYLDFNLGDDLFIKTLIDRYKGHNLYLVTKDEKFLEPFKKYENVFGVSYKEVFMDTKKYDGCVIIGGSIFQDYGNKRDYLNYIRRNLVIKSFKLKNKPVFIMGSNIGPINTKVGKEIFKTTFNNATFTSVRDLKSYNLLKDLNIKSRYDIYPDIVFSLKDNVKNETTKDENILGISVINYDREKEHQPSYINKMVEIINEYKNTNQDAKVYLFGFDAGHQNDGEVIDKIIDKVQSKENVLKVMYEGDMELFLDKFSSSSFIIGSRFHSVILALKYNISFFPIIYSSKTENLLNDIGYNLDCVKYEDINSLDTKKIIENINNNKYNYRINEEYVFKSEGHFKELDKLIR